MWEGTHPYASEQPLASDCSKNDASREESDVRRHRTIRET
jgi:hypothetical protein